MSNVLSRQLLVSKGLKRIYVARMMGPPCLSWKRRQRLNKIDTKLFFQGVVITSFSSLSVDRLGN